ncbi:prepilin-type N-terminal cleavage/methylation domain-containing protein [Desulfobaculum senezii]
MMRTSAAGPSNSAFTLLEVLVVLVIASCAAGLAFAPWRGGGSAEALHATARRCAAVVQRARTQAMLTGQPWQVVVDLDAQTVSARPLGAPESPQRRAGRVTVREPRRILWARTAVSGGDTLGRQDAGRVVLVAQPSGLVEPVVLCVGDGQARVWARVKALSQRVTVSRTPVE